MKRNSEVNLEKLRMLKAELTRFMMTYKFGLSEMNTKIEILKEEFQYIHDYNPIEYIKTRIKSPESILKKISVKGCELSLPSIREDVYDIAGICIICSYTSDIYKISKMLQKQKNITFIKCKDYIENPKASGYRSLHLIVRVPVFMSDRMEEVPVEIQIRTIAMDF